MRRSLPLVAVAGVVVLLASGCGASRAGTPAPGPGRSGPADPPGPLAAEVVAFEPGGFAPEPLAAISTTPIRLDAFASWFAGAGTLEHTPENEQAKPGTTYVAAAAQTGCRAPESVEVTRAGTDLRVEFVGGTDRPECYRPVGPLAVVAVPSEDVRGVRTVNGAAPVAPEGPGRLADFVSLGTGNHTPNPAELGDTATLRADLEESGVDVTGPVAAALDRTVAAGERGFAFVLPGCTETSAVLLLDHDKISADLTGGDGAMCDAPQYFLATLVAPADKVPDGAVLGR